MPHDESMKFILKYDKESDLNTKLFKFAKEGQLKKVDYDED